MVRPISGPEHLDHIRERSSVSFLQTPAWAAVKNEWRGESLGWFDEGKLVGVGLVLFRQVPRVKRYLRLPSRGPDIDWLGQDLGRWLTPLAAYLKDQKAFGIRMGPPVVTRRWHAATVKAAIADPALRTWETCRPTRATTPRWASSPGCASWAGSRCPPPAGSPPVSRSTTSGFRWPTPTCPRSRTTCSPRMNQQWRRNIRKAAKAGVEVTRGTRDDLADFHRIYVETAERDHFTPRPLTYFERMWDALGARRPTGCRSTWLTTTATWWPRRRWSRSASTRGTPTARPPRQARRTRLQRRPVADDARRALPAPRCTTCAASPTRSADDPQLGLLQFKVGTGGQAVEYLGEWDLPLKRGLYKAFMAWMKRRGWRRQPSGTSRSATARVAEPPSGRRGTGGGDMRALRSPCVERPTARHLAAVADGTPGIVPVIKGNGYGVATRLRLESTPCRAAPTSEVPSTPLVRLRRRRAGDDAVAPVLHLGGPRCATRR